METKVVFDGIGTLQQQICRSLRYSISSGYLKANSRLAPSRVFAEEYGVSRNTVIAAFDQLCAEGYLLTRPGAGTFVTDVTPAPPSEQRLESLLPAWSEATRRVTEEVPDHMLGRQRGKKLRYDFLYGEPGYADLPLDRWSRTVGRCARELSEKQLGYGSPMGLPKLRAVLAEYLGRARGVNCEPEQVLITQGTQDAIDLVVRAFVDYGERVVLEEPHYRGFMRSLLAAGADVASVPVDEFGVDTDVLGDIEDAKVAFVTPSHQFPFGSVMSLGRRQQFLAWAKENGTVVFEDDYDGEFRYESRPIPSLQSLDELGQVIYVGTASKMLFPSLRLGWMVLPKQMVTTFERWRALTNSSGPILEQMAFAEFVGEGHLERHIHKARRMHQQRRQVLLETLKERLGNEVEIKGTEAGIHVLVRLPGLPVSKTQELIERAAQQQVGVYSSEIYYTKAPKELELLMGYAALSPAQISTGVKRLVKVIQSM